MVTMEIPSYLPKCWLFVSIQWDNGPRLGWMRLDGVFVGGETVQCQMEEAILVQWAGLKLNVNQI